MADRSECCRFASVEPTETIELKKRGDERHCHRARESKKTRRLILAEGRCDARDREAIIGKGL